MSQRNNGVTSSISSSNSKTNGLLASAFAGRTAGQSNCFGLRGSDAATWGAQVTKEQKNTLKFLRRRNQHGRSLVSSVQTSAPPMLSYVEHSNGDLMLCRWRITRFFCYRFHEPLLSDYGRIFPYVFGQLGSNGSISTN